MKILITGGAGFIGSHVADLFIASGHAVHIVDNLSRGKIENLNRQATFHPIDILDRERLEALCDKVKFDAISHQAAFVSVRESFEKPIEYASVNIIGSLNLLECARRTHVQKFIYASSGGAVYGEPAYLPVDEDHPLKPLDIYGVSKRDIEYYLSLYKTQFGISYTVLRYANVYGPRQDPQGENGVVTKFANVMLKNDQPIVINGSGEQMRDFVYVEDVARANLLALSAGTDEILNIASHCGVSINEIYETLRELTDYPHSAVHGSPKRGEVFKIWLSNQKAKEKLGWMPQVELKDGLSRTVKFQKRQL